MTTQQLKLARPGRNVAAAKASARAAYVAAKAAGGPLALAADRYWSETLVAAEGREAVATSGRGRKGSLREHFPMIDGSSPSSGRTSPGFPNWKSSARSPIWREH
jgi:hypothetical protein